MGRYVESETDLTEELEMVSEKRRRIIIAIYNHKMILELYQFRPAICGKKQRTAAIFIYFIDIVTTQSLV